MTNRPQHRGAPGNCVRVALASTIILVSAFIGAQSAPNNNFKVLHTFNGVPDGGNPEASVTRDRTGSLYGTTYSRGASSNCCGTAFKVDTAGTFTVVHQFGSPGAYPAAPVVRDAVGNLYGTTTRGGHREAGIIFQLDTTGKLSELYSFLGSQEGNEDGAFPRAGLVRDAAGDLFGTTSQGGGMTGCSGDLGCGTVFKLDTFIHETVLHIFTGGSDGGVPLGGLVQDQAGNLYGTTSLGGTGAGTVFKVDKTGVLTVLYSFTGGADGNGPEAGLVQDSAGNLYGTTVAGGAHGFGTVFKVDTSGTETVLHSFKGFPSDGAGPVAELVQDAAGNFYGTTKLGGEFKSGAVFKLSTTGEEWLLYSFSGGADGKYPASALIRDGAGKLYGTTEAGGTAGCGKFGGCGVVFEIHP
jgi:uncharacterized repeat protein (TIGR03803 family)